MSCIEIELFLLNNLIMFDYFNTRTIHDIGKSLSFPLCNLGVKRVEHLLYMFRTIEVFRNEILAAWQEGLNIEMILISEFMNSEIRITSNNFCRTDSHF